MLAHSLSNIMLYCIHLFRWRASRRAGHCPFLRESAFVPTIAWYIDSRRCPRDVLTSPSSSKRCSVSELGKKRARCFVFCLGVGSLLDSLDLVLTPALSSAQGNMRGMVCLEGSYSRQRCLCKKSIVGQLEMPYSYHLFNQSLEACGP